MKNTENTRKAGEDKENRRTGWQENALIKSFPIKTKKDLKEMRRRTEWRVDVDRCGSWRQSADLLISNTEKQKRTRYKDTQQQTSDIKLYHEQRKHTHFIISTMLWGVKTFLRSLRESESSTSVSQHIVIINTAITSEKIKNLFNSVKKLNIFPSRCWGEFFRIQEIPSEPVWVFFSKLHSSDLFPENPSWNIFPRLHISARARN